jgi:outer membrane lipoprotein-sorting protein
VAADLDEVLAAYHEARGGEEAWKAVESMRMSCLMQMGGGAMEAPVMIEFKRPNKVRVEITFQGMTGINAYDGETGWMIMPFMGKTEPEELADDQLKDLQEQAEFEGLLVNYEEKGHTVELIGEEEVEGTPAYKLKITKANGDIVYTYLDSEYFLEFKSETKRMVQGNEVEVSSISGDYKEVDGLVIPHSIEVSFGNMPAQQVITIEKIEFGVELPDDRFIMPTPAPKDEGATETEG